MTTALRCRGFNQDVSLPSCSICFLRQAWRIRRRASLRRRSRRRWRIALLLLLLPLVLVLVVLPLSLPPLTAAADTETGCPALKRGHSQLPLRVHHPIWSRPVAEGFAGRDRSAARQWSRTVITTTKWTQQPGKTQGRPPALQPAVPRRGGEESGCGAMAGEWTSSDRCLCGDWRCNNIVRIVCIEHVLSECVRLSHSGRACCRLQGCSQDCYLITAQKTLKWISSDLFGHEWLYVLTNNHCNHIYMMHPTLNFPPQWAHYYITPEDT